MNRDLNLRESPFSPSELEGAIKVLEALAQDRGLLAALDRETRRELLEAAGRLARPTPEDRRRLAKALRRKDRAAEKAADVAVLDATGIRALRRTTVFLDAEVPAAPPGELREPRKCYVCKSEFLRVHFFYDQMCPGCAELNFHKRNQTADLRGRVALVTGGRVKIGYQIGLKLLRAGARVIVTTRFPHDAARRYGAEWRDQLRIFGLDLRHTPSVERFAQHLCATEERLDFIINNACQTVRRPTGFYAHLEPTERAALPPELAAMVPAGPPLRAFLPIPDAATGELMAPGPSLFPQGALDQDLQQLDLRPQNSWRLPMSDVPTIELLEVHLCNVIAPFVLNARLKPLLVRDRSVARHIVNVSAMEGQFNRAHKTDKHPHTNMAKAALNMMTRTSAQDYAQDGIFMHAVDTGWVTDEDPEHLAARKTAEHGFHPPLDIVDGAARVLDPIFTDVRDFGRFWKDYFPTEW